MRKKKNKNRKANRKNAPKTVRAASLVPFAYDAARNTPMRSPIVNSVKSEDYELRGAARGAIVSSARDAYRNFSVAGFALRKYLQSVAFYDFHAGTPDAEFNRDLERRVKRWKRSENCDVSGRMSFDQLVYIIESHRAIDGDVGVLRLSDGRLQVIEGDRIKSEADADGWTNGVRVDATGRPLEYSIYRRKGSGGLEFDRIESAQNFDLFAYRFRYDQTRGVSPLAAALRSIDSLYGAVDAALVKLRLEQCVGLKTVFSDAGGTGRGATQNETRSGEQESQFRRAEEQFQGELLHFNLREGEDVSFLESNNPSQNFQSFIENVLRMIFAAFDLPYSFYDGSKTNYYGSEGEFEQFVDGVEQKQRPTIEILNRWITEWLVPNWILDDANPLVLPSGWTIDDIAADCGWRGAGLPTWRMYRHVKDMQTALNLGMLNPYEVAAEYGFYLDSNLDAIKKYRNACAERGIYTSIGAETKVNVGL